MTVLPAELLQELGKFDSPTLFNALTKVNGEPNEDYTDHTIRCLLPEFGSSIGYAVTAEVTTNDADSAAVDWDGYYDVLDERDGPTIAVIKDVDSRPGRGASFGDGMATIHKALGVAAAIVDGTVRDLTGIRNVPLPIYAWGVVPGHGQFNLTRFEKPLTMGQLRIRPGDLLFADSDGVVRIPNERAADVLRCANEVREFESEVIGFCASDEFSLAEMRRRRAQKK